MHERFDGWMNQLISLLTSLLQTVALSGLCGLFDTCHKRYKVTIRV